MAGMETTNHSINGTESNRQIRSFQVEDSDVSVDGSGVITITVNGDDLSTILNENNTGSSCLASDTARIFVWHIDHWNEL